MKSPALCLLLLCLCSCDRNSSSLLITHAEEPDTNPAIQVEARNAKLLHVVEATIKPLGYTLGSYTPDCGALTISASFRQVHWQRALNELLRVHNLKMLQEGKQLHLVTLAEYAALPSIEKHYRISNPHREAAMKLLQEELKSLPIDFISIDPDRTGLTISCHREVHTDIAQTLAWVNQFEQFKVYQPLNWPTALPKALKISLIQDRLPNQAVSLNLQHVDARRLAAKLQETLPDSAPCITPYTQDNALLIHSSAENIARIKAACQYFDHPRWYANQQPTPLIKSLLGG